MPTKETTIKAAIAHSHLEKARKAAAKEKHRTAAAYFTLAAGVLEDIRNFREAAHAWRRASEHSEKRSWEVDRNKLKHDA